MKKWGLIKSRIIGGEIEEGRLKRKGGNPRRFNRLGETQVIREIEARGENTIGEQVLCWWRAFEENDTVSRGESVDDILFSKTRSSHNA